MMSDWQLYQLLAQMLGGSHLEQRVEQANQVDCWAQLLLLSSHHLVTTQLYWRLSNNDLAWNLVAADQQCYLEEIFALNRTRNEQLTAEVEAILSSLNQAGIRPLLTKGTARLFSPENPSSGYRMQLDADLLVPKQDLQLAANSLQDMGYEYAEETRAGLTAVTDRRLSRLMSIYKHHQHVPPFIHPEKRTVIELHRHLYSERFQKHYPLNGLLDRASPMSDRGLDWYQLSINDELQYLLTQGYMDPGFKRSYYLPLRLGCDYLDLRERLSKIEAGAPPSVNKNIAATHFFAEQLIQHIFLAPAATASPNNAQVNRYLKRMQAFNERPYLGTLVNAYGSFVRKAINLAHDPGLIRRRF